MSMVGPPSSKVTIVEGVRSSGEFGWNTIVVVTTQRGCTVQVRRCCVMLVTLAVVVSLPVLAMSGVASAKAPGCHKTHSCKSGGSTGGATGSPTPGPITIQIDPNPLVETGQSNILTVVQVETSASFAGDPVLISSSQLLASCGFFEFGDDAPTDTVFLDDDGNADATFFGQDCAPGTDVVDASMTAAPYLTAIGTLTAAPPVVTTAGVSGYPTYSGTVTTGEVETGNTINSGDSDAIAVFYVETSPVYAEQPVETSSAQLEGRCGEGWEWLSPSGILTEPAPGPGSVTGTGVNLGSPVQSVLDDDGNAVFFFGGGSCAAGSSEVIADVEAGSHPTYTTTFTIVAPQPTI
jgi:hypothetical protein